MTTTDKKPAPKPRPHPKPKPGKAPQPNPPLQEQKRWIRTVRYVWDKKGGK